MTVSMIPITIRLMVTDSPQSPSGTAIVSDGIFLTARYQGSKTFSNLIIFRTQLENAIIKLRTQGKHVQLLIDITELDQHDITPESRAEFIKITQLDFDNAAVLADKRVAKVIKAIVQNSNRRYRVQFFTDKALPINGSKQEGRLKSSDCGLVL